MLTKEQEHWLLDRCNESHTGRVLIPTYVIKKYMKLTGETDRLIAIISIENLFSNPTHTHFPSCSIVTIEAERGEVNE